MNRSHALYDAWVDESRLTATPRSERRWHVPEASQTHGQAAFAPRHVTSAGAIVLRQGIPLTEAELEQVGEMWGVPIVKRSRPEAAAPSCEAIGHDWQQAHSVATVECAAESLIRYGNTSLTANCQAGLKWGLTSQLVMTCQALFCSSRPVKQTYLRRMYRHSLAWITGTSAPRWHLAASDAA